MAIKTIINGAHGKMGKVACATINNETDLTLVASIDRNDDLAKTITETNADVVIDFTRPDSVFENTQTIIQHNARPVIGTTGLTLNQIDTLKTLCKNQSLGGIIAPNFSLGAVLMMKYAKDAAKYLPNVEIIEMHHAQKIDAPSGTATKTAELIAEANPEILKHTNSSSASSNPALGTKHKGVTIHSVRLPGLFAHQTVIFGGVGETLTIRHDGMDRQAMMPGLFLACRKVMELDHLVYGLDNVI